MAGRPTVRVRELRRYRSLFDQADAAKDAHRLARVAARTDRDIEHWLLLQSMKDKLAERARKIGVPCRRESDLCFDYLLDLADPQRDLF